MRKSLVVLLLLAAVAGCGVQRPIAEVTEVRVDGTTEQGSRIVARVALQNRSDNPLPVRETRYSLSVGGEEFRFTEVAAVTIPAGGMQTITLPAAVQVPRDALPGRPYRLTGTVVYEPPGELRDLLTDSGLPLPSVSFSQAGRLAEAATPPAP